MSSSDKPLFEGTWFRRIFPPWVLAVMGWANVVAVVADLRARHLEGGPLFGIALCWTLYQLTRGRPGNAATGGPGQGEPPA